MHTCKVCGLKKAHYACIISKCKDCWKAHVRAYRAANLDRIQAYDRQRGGLPHRKADRAARAVRYKDKHKESILLYQANNPVRRQAHVIVGNAIRDGKLIPAPCERCGAALNVHAHHEDYSKPLDVNWLCRACHGQRHREINEERRKAG